MIVPASRAAWTRMTSRLALRIALLHCFAGGQGDEGRDGAERRKQKTATQDGSPRRSCRWIHLRGRWCTQGHRPVSLPHVALRKPAHEAAFSPMNPALMHSEPRAADASRQNLVFSSTGQ